MTKAKSTDVGAARSRESDEVQTVAEVFVAPPHSCFFVWRPPLENATLSGGGIAGSRKTAPDLPHLALYCEECEGERSFSGFWIAVDSARYDKGPPRWHSTI